MSSSGGTAKSESSAPHPPFIADEAALRALLAAGEVWLFEWDCGEDVVRRSPEAAGVLGLPASAAEEEPAVDHAARIHPEDQPGLLDVLKTCTPDRPRCYRQYRYLCPDGRTRWIEERACAVFDGQGDMSRLQGVAIDITRRRAMEEEAEGTAAAVVAAQTAVDVIDALGEGLALLDVDGRVVYVNPAFTTITSLQIGEIRGRTLRDLLPYVFDEDSHLVRETMVRVRRHHGVSDESDALSVTDKEGRSRWIVPSLARISGKDQELVGSVMTLRDVSSLKRFQESLEESERKYRELVDSANSVILRFTPEFRVTFINEYAQRFLGHPRDDIVGRSLLHTILPERDSMGQRSREMLQALARQPEMHGSVELEALCRDGRRVWIHWSTRAIRDEYGEVREILCVGTDITDRKQAEHEAFLYRRRLQHLAERLAATEEKERRRVSSQLHDTVIQTLSLSNVRLGAIRRSVTAAGLRDVEERLDQVRELVNRGITECRMLMSELTPPLLYELGLGPALRDMAETLQKEHGTPIRVEDGSGSVRREPDKAVRGLLYQSARELVINALKHAGRCEIRIVLSGSGDEIRLEVCDTGKGMEAAGPHARGHDGSGFGLFSIRERLFGLGGRMEISSSPGEGTAVRILLPLAREDKGELEEIGGA